MHRAEWQTLTWMLVSAILVYVLIGPNIVTVALAVIGTLAAFFKAGLEQWQRWQLARSSKEHAIEHQG